MMKKSLSRVLRRVFDGVRDPLIEDHIRKNAEALEMKRLAAEAVAAEAPPDPLSRLRSFPI